jgi:FkbM family methyltransferase
MDVSAALDQWQKRYSKPRMSVVIELLQFILAHPLTKHSPVRALARVAMWQIRSRIQSEAVIPWVGDQKLIVKRGMTGATGNIYVGLHEFVDMMFVLHFLRRGDLFLDIGANVGTYTVLASGVCKAETWAFEPDRSAAHALKRNIEVNKLQTLVVVHEVVLGGCEGEVAFTIGEDTKNRVTRTGGRSQILRQKPLDSIIGGHKPILAKLDVEGYEEEVLFGANALLSKDLPQVLALETVSDRSEKMLYRHGFKRVFYNPFERVLSTEWLGMTSSNALFVRDISLVRKRLREAPKIRILNLMI